MDRQCLVRKGPDYCPKLSVLEAGTWGHRDLYLSGSFIKPAAFPQGSGSDGPAGGILLHVTSVNLLMRDNLSLLAQNLPMAPMSLWQSQSPDWPLGLV